MAADSKSRTYRDGDSPHGLSNAIIRYLSTHMGEAFDLADQICDANGEPRLLTWDECWDIIGGMDPEDAFCAGMTSDAIGKGHYHTFDGNSFSTIPDHWAYMKDILYFASEDIARGRYEISKELQAVINAAGRGDFRNCNAKPAGKVSNNARTKAKTTARKPAKATSKRR